MLELNLADGNALDIPASSISMFEGLETEKNENFPEANSFIRYSLGETDNQALLIETFDDLVRLLDINVRPGLWLRLNNANGNKMAVFAPNIVARKALSSGTTELTILLSRDGLVGTFTVVEGRDAIKAMMEDLNRPAGLIEMPAANLEKEVVYP